MTDHIELPPEDESEKPRVIVVIGGHEPMPRSISRQLMILAATHMIVLAHTQEDLEREELPSLQDLTAIVLSSHGLRDIPPIMLSSCATELCHDYNARAGQGPRKQDLGMMVKAHNTTDRMAAKAVRFRHFHY